MLRTLPHNGSLDWSWAQQSLEDRLQRIKDRREARAELRREMAAVGDAGMEDL